MTNKKTIKTAAIAGLVGAGVGLTVGYLTAPKSGKETRADIANKSREIKEDIVERYEALHESIGDAIEAGLARASELTGASKKALEGLIDQAKEAEFKAVNVYRAVKNGESDDKNLERAISHATKVKDNLKKYLDE
jgi:gas vesicle protein